MVANGARPLPPVKAGCRRFLVLVAGWPARGRVILPPPVTFDAQSDKAAERYVEGLFSKAAPAVQWEAMAL